MQYHFDHCFSHESQCCNCYTRVDLMIKFIHQNDGHLSKAKREKYFESIEDEIVVQLVAGIKKYLCPYLKIKSRTGCGVFFE